MNVINPEADYNATEAALIIVVDMTPGVFSLPDPSEQHLFYPGKSAGKEASMSKRPNEQNERLKRRFLEYSKHARQLSNKTIDCGPAALERFDVWNGRKDFGKFHIEWAKGVPHPSGAGEDRQR